jgi:hypothetical protein
MAIIKKVSEREPLPPNNKDLNLHELRYQKIQRKKIEIGKGLNGTVDALGESNFKHCDLRIRMGGRYTAVATRKCTFDNCLIWPDRIQNIPKWDAEFRNCAFKGKYEARFVGAVQNCDFSQATLKSGHFMHNSSLGRVVWPGFPHIIISHSPDNLADWRATAGTGEISWVYWSEKIHGHTVVLNLESLVKDVESFWDCIKDKDYVDAVGK